MAYTIKINNGTHEKAYNVREALIKKLQQSKVFRAQVLPVTFFEKGSKEGSRAEGYGFAIKFVRLRKAKPYCGNHPGECFVEPGEKPGKKPTKAFLEWEDWIKFHRFVNALLNVKAKDCDVWTTGSDADGIMWIRKGVKPRKIYNWTTDDKNPRLKHWCRGNDPLSLTKQRITNDL